MKGSRLAMLTVVSAVSVSLTILLAPFLIVANAPTPNPAVLIDGETIANLIAISYSINDTGEINGTLGDALVIVGEIVLEGDNGGLVGNYLSGVAQTTPFQLGIVYSIGLEFGEPIEEQGLLRRIYCDEAYCTSISGKIEGQSAVTTITFQGTRLRFETIE